MKFKLALLILPISLLLVVCNNAMVSEKKSVKVDSHLNTALSSDEVKIKGTKEPKESKADTSDNTSDVKTSQTKEIFKDKTTTVTHLEQMANITDVLVSDYENGLINAINNNDFTQVEPYLVINSPLYEAQKKLVTDLYSQGIKEKLISFESGKSYLQGKSDTCKVEVIEKIEISQHGKDTVTKDFQWLYTMKYDAIGAKFSQIEKWTNFENDISNRMAGSKSDGYYADELIDNVFDRSFIEKINGRVPRASDISLTSDAALTNYLNLSNSICEKGTNFELVNSEILNRNLTLPREVTKKLTISYKDSNSKQLTITITLVVEER